MSTATLTNPADVEELIGQLAPPAPEPDPEAYRQLVVATAAGERLPTGEIRAALDLARRTPRQFAHDVLRLRQRRAAVEVLAAAERETNPAIVEARKHADAARAAEARERPSLEQLIADAQKQLAALEQVRVAAETELRAACGQFDQHVAAARETVMQTAPARIHQRLAEIARQTQDLAAHELRRKGWSDNNRKVRQALADAEADRDDLNQKVNSNQASRVDIDNLKHLARIELPQIRGALAKSEADRPPAPEVIDARQRELIAEHNRLVEQLLDADQIDLI